MINRRWWSRSFVTCEVLFGFLRLVYEYYFTWRRRLFSLYQSTWSVECYGSEQWSETLPYFAKTLANMFNRLLYYYIAILLYLCLYYISTNKDMEIKRLDIQGLCPAAEPLHRAGGRAEMCSELQRNVGRRAGRWASRSVRREIWRAGPGATIYFKS